MGIRVESIKQHTYGGKARPVGATYEVPGAGDLRLVAALGWAKERPAAAAVTSRFDPPVKPAAPPAAPEPIAEVVQQETPADDGETAAVEHPKPAMKRAYRRRDMTAEE